LDDPRGTLFATPVRPTIGAIFSIAHRLYSARWGLVVGVSVVAIVLNIVLSALAGVFDRLLVGPNTLIRPATLLAQTLVGAPLVVGPLYVVVRIFRGEPAEFTDMFIGFQRWGIIVGVAAIIGVLNFVLMLPLQLAMSGFGTSTGGNLALMVAVILLGSLMTVGVLLWINIRLYFAPLLCVDPAGPRLGIINSIKTSWTMTNGYVRPLFVVAIALGIIAGVSLLLLIIPFILYGGPLIACVGGVAYALICHRTGVIPLAPYTECPYCEYDLRQSESDRCPECGNFVDREAVGGNSPLN
jgi:uncharacterized membrane protein